ncbi:uncharacterized protein LOC126427293 isoform X3 [Schistocerca serialis cubense]|uniref:uncharacterized protein LOC126427293 isoform X3 n=1 Tax=Schistocerca serialis cubense TaxID=2023355 RepID=UPI00214F0E8F|nr:uncharacterized protein LOC126427293 isoform X3 [Schistocerca serialis cubense]
MDYNKRVWIGKEGTNEVSTDPDFVEGAPKRRAAESIWSIKSASEAGNVLLEEKYLQGMSGDKLHISAVQFYAVHGAQRSNWYRIKCGNMEQYL